MGGEADLGASGASGASGAARCRVAVVGGGFAGLLAVRAPHRGPFDVTDAGSSRAAQRPDG